MSEVIVRMEMPLNCEHCPMSHWNKLNELTGCDAVGGKRYVSDDDEFWRVPRPSWCPIIGVLPEQHGRLVDAKHFEVVSYTENEIEQAGYCWRSFDDGVEWLLNQVDATPTIVPATERSET